jgi:2-amino-4-hydroxy-6-hydroxymethyldihydropteridine diphosphokinase
VSDTLAIAEIAYVGLGANLADPCAQVERAVPAIGALPLTRLCAVSSLYRTAPVGPADQPDYINAVVRLETRLSPRRLLAELQRIERGQGRVRDGTRWGPRTLDLDILTFGTRHLRSPGLTLPHPEMHRRAFVLVPLGEIAPSDLPIPGCPTLGELLAEMPHNGVERLAGRGCTAEGAAADDRDIGPEALAAAGLDPPSTGPRAPGPAR